MVLLLATKVHVAFDKDMIVAGAEPTPPNEHLTGKGKLNLSPSNVTSVPSMTMFG
jgi:hypothetical protein